MVPGDLRESQAPQAPRVFKVSRVFPVLRVPPAPLGRKDFPVKMGLPV